MTATAAAGIAATEEVVVPDQDYNKTLTDSGLTIVSEKMPWVRSASVGIWVKTGSRYENAEQAGISHMLEHMVFKGTSRRSGLEIVQAIEGVGGHINAFTSKELTCFYVQVLDEHIDLALDVLCDLLISPTLANDDIEREKLVITEEIRHYEDSPHELVFDFFASTLHGDHPLARPIMGSVETVSSLNRKMLRGYLEKYYPSNRTVVAATGNLVHDHLVREIQNRLTLGQKPAINGATPVAYPQPRTECFARSVQGAHLCRGVQGVSFDDERKFAALILSNILGGGMSSRLFQRIREKEALAYSVFSFLETMLDTGIFGIYLGTDPDRLDRALEVIDEEYTQILNQGIPPDELERAKEQLKGNLMLGLEGTAGRMFRLAKLEIYLSRFMTLDETLSLISSVSEDGIMELAQAFLDIQKQYTAIILPKEEADNDHRSSQGN
jgi:predicted Zn-dependent peptidase